MSSLTAIFGRARDDSSNSDKLLELYWNRAELKKDFANLRKETFRLKDRIKEEKGNAARSQHQLLQLETLLLDPDWVHSVAVYYQLRALNLHLQRKVARFAEQLKQQREQRQHRQRLSEWADRQNAEAAELDSARAKLRQQLAEADGRLHALHAKYGAMNRFMRFLRKRSTKRALDAIAMDIEAGQAQERQLAQARAELEKRQAPDVEGLDIGAKRSINCMILAFLQQVFLHYREDDIAALSQDAGCRGVGAVRYGSKADCDALLSRVARLRETMAKTSEFADVLQQRARLIAERARFAGDGEAVPTPDSVDVVFDLHDSGLVRELEAGLLRDNYWGIESVLSR